MDSGTEKMPWLAGSGSVLQATRAVSKIPAHMKKRIVR